MNLENLKKATLTILSILILCLTFGLYSLPRAEVQIREVQVKDEARPVKTAHEATDDQLLLNLKEKVEADYRANIAGSQASGHMG